jgi:uncharacterized repeat protein (TIGR03837 family)
MESLWRRLAIAPRADGEIRVTLFTYPGNGAVAGLLDAWADGDVPVTCVAPAGAAVRAIDAFTGGAMPAPGGAPFRRGRLTLAVIDFLPQDEFDLLLFASDVNLVRGEDSFVRAQWAARPFGWNIYPQDEGAHWRKLDGFVDRYARCLDGGLTATVRRFHNALNGKGGAAELADAWPAFDAARETLRAHGLSWAAEQAAIPGLASGLVKAARKPL